MKRNLRNLVSFLLMFLMILGLFASITLPVGAQADVSDILANKTKLRFGADGEFKVLILPDVHVYNGGLTAAQQNLIKTTVDKEQPDFVILTGDNVRALSSNPITNESQFRTALDSMVGYLESKGIYWMHVYGNHDEENNAISLEQQQVIYESYPHCLSKDSVKSLNGVGNYVVPLYGSDTSQDEIKFAFWGLDSGNRLTAEELQYYFPDGSVTSSYDFIHEDQVEWYVETSKAIENSVGAKVPGLMAFHIPLNEYETAWNERTSSIYSDEKNEGVSKSKCNGGLYDAMVERGDIKATVCGHDHINNFMVEYGGIKLCYSGKMSTNGYHDEACMGGRVFVIKEQTPEQVDTYMSYLNDRSYLAIENGNTYDFEQETDFTVGYASYSPTENRHDTIYAEIVDGKGIENSRALATCRTEWHSEKKAQNVAVKWNMSTAGRLGDNQYLMVWMDLKTHDIDFRKASFGLLTENGQVFCTDNYGAGAEFYVLEEGSEQWTAKTMGSDGCFGAGDSCSVKGMRGWFAFKIENMVNGTDFLTDQSIVSGFYFYYSPANAEQVNKPVYIDNVMLVKDYSTVLSPYGKITGTKNGNVILPDENVYFFNSNWSEQPKLDANNQFDYTFGDGSTFGDGKTYRLTWGTNAFAWSNTQLKSILAEQSANWVRGTASRNIVIVFAPGEYGATGNLNNLTSRASVGVPSKEQLANVYLLGAQAGVNPVSDQRDTKSEALEVQNGRSVDTSKESVINDLWRFPGQCNIIMDGFAANSAAALFTQSETKFFDVYVKNHYVDELTTATYNTILYTRHDAFGMYEFENAYFNMNLTTAATKEYKTFLSTNKAVFNNCAFVNSNDDYYSPSIEFIPKHADDAENYENFFGESAASPLFEVNHCIVADWQSVPLFSFDITQSRFYAYQDNSIKLRFADNAIFDCGKTGESTSVISFTDATTKPMANSYELILENNLFAFSDEAFAQSGASSVVNLGKPSSEAIGTKITFTGNTVSVPADSEITVFAGYSNSCTLWTSKDNIYQDNAATPLAMNAPLMHKWETEYTIDVAPTLEKEGSKSYHCEYCDVINSDSVVSVPTLCTVSINGSLYASLGEALAAATAGDSVVLHSDAATELLILQPEVTLDLNGNILTANYVVGLTGSALIDSSSENTGRLAVDQNQAALDKENGKFLPVYDAQNGCFLFTTVQMREQLKAGSDQYLFSPIFESFAHRALASGKENSATKVMLRVTWKADEYEVKQEFVYTDALVKQVMESYNTEYANDYKYAFSALLKRTGEENGALTVSAVVISDIGTEVVSEGLLYLEQD